MVEFASHPNSHLVICSYGKFLAVWDVITMALLWAVPFVAESIAVDTATNLVAAFSAKKNLYFFRPEVPEPIAIHNNVSRSQVVSSVFVPASAAMCTIGLKSTLIFINSSQELCMLEPREEGVLETFSKLKIGSQGPNYALTPFAKLIAEKTVSVPKNKGPGLSPYNMGSHITREIMSASPHTMPSVSYFCNHLLSAISVQQSESTRLAMIEDHVVKSFQRDRNNPERSLDIKINHENDVEMKDIQAEALAAPMTFQQYDISLISNEDTSWISAVFNPV